MTAIIFPVESLLPRPADDLAMGMRLSMSQGREIQPIDIFKILNAAGLKAVLIGAHAVNVRTGRPRATVDVDLVAAKPKNVVQALQLAFPHLVLEDHPVVYRFKDDRREAIDVIKPRSSPLFARILKLTEEIEVDGIPLRIPDIEAMLALKFASMVTPTRQIEDRYADARDFILVAKGASSLIEPKLDELGELVFPGGGKNLLKLVADARAGRRLDI